jgi:precorrin-2 dehydrogenase
VSYYPVFLDLRGRRALVVGGGPVADQKVARLLRAGAEVTVVAPRAVESLVRLAEGGRLALFTRAYSPDDMRGIDLAIAATNDAGVNRGVSADARRSGVLVNVVDGPEQSSFIAPAILERGALQVAVSTSGASPSFAAFVRDRLAAEIGPEYEAALRVLRSVRERLRAEARPAAERKRVLASLAASGLVERVRAKDRPSVDRLLRSLVGEEVTLEGLGVGWE